MHIKLPRSESGDWDFKEFGSEPLLMKTSDVEKRFRLRFVRNVGDKYYLFFWDSHNRWYLAEELDDGNCLIIGYLKVKDYPKIHNSYQIDGIEIHPNYRSKGLSTFMYREINAKTGKTLVSDFVQYDNSRKIWLALSNSHGVKMFDTRTGEKTDVVKIKDLNDPEIWGNVHANKLLIYETKVLELG